MSLLADDGFDGGVDRGGASELESDSAGSSGDSRAAGAAEDLRNVGLEVKAFQRTVEDFTCGNCQHLQHGDGYTNHCSECLWSKHVDVRPGDRAADCSGLMTPITADVRGTEYRVLQRCQLCDHERWNKVRDTDNFQVVLHLTSQACPELRPSRGGAATGRGRGGRGGRGSAGKHGKQARGRR